MTTPRALKTDADALFLFTIGFDHLFIGFDGRLVEESIGLLLLHLLASPIDPLHRLHDFGRVKLSAEITSGGWIWNAFGAQSIQIGAFR